jgi:hypothetical protein
VLDEKSRLKADLEKTQSDLLKKSQSADGDELRELEKRMESVKLEMESVRKVSFYYFFHVTMEKSSRPPANLVYYWEIT